jgi:GNAT superfamily N-acetyltransferase
MDDVVVRTAIRPDLAGVLLLYKHLNPADPTPDPAQAETAWSTLLDSPLTTVFVADVGGVPVASCTLVVVPNLTRGTRPYGLIENVVTHADYRRRGLGKTVLTAALDAAWDANCYKVMLATGSRNPATLRFYHNAGFVRNSKTFFEARRIKYDRAEPLDPRLRGDNG